MGVVSVNNILDAGLATQGKFPDIYWELDLNGSEIKILRYIFNNCLRLYTKLKYFPRGKDGSPRYWRGKEKMANDCGVSYPTFRNSVRHLSELGLVTSMDSIEDSEELHCVGLSSDFLDKFINSALTEKSFRLHNLYSLISLIYDNLTLEILNNQKELDNIPLFSTIVENKPCGTQTEDSNSNMKKSQATKKTKVVRKAIKIKRTPIMVLPESIRMQSAQEKLKLLQYVRTPYENKVLQVCEYYEYKCRQAIHSSGFKALGKDFRNHKNWKFFVRIYELCKNNDWDYKVYIDAQFDRVRFWARKQPYPYANQFTSEGAIKYYHGYVQNYKDSNSVTGDIKVKTDTVKSVSQQIIDDVIKDCEGIVEYIEKAKKRRANKGLSEEQIKILYLSDHWTGLSVSYLACIPWFLTYLNQFPEETFLIELKQSIEAIRKSKSLYKTTLNIVQNVEKQMGVPETLCL